ncbi:hypothetical protein AX15_007472 [Amanita polypyramis BW_CC]|nr:hypothetical protein AX15_007472 [Amanita polypyramis BW_CC]
MASSPTIHHPSYPAIGGLPQLDTLSWVPFSIRLVVADYISRGHPSCVGYAVASWPESVLAADDWHTFGELPATTPVKQTVVLKYPSHFLVEVRASSHPYVTIVDILQSIYKERRRFPQARFIGLSPSGHNYLRVHFEGSTWN